jgi:hypothetical protein
MTPDVRVSAGVAEIVGVVATGAVVLPADALVPAADVAEIAADTVVLRAAIALVIKIQIFRVSSRAKSRDLLFPQAALRRPKT